MRLKRNTLDTFIGAVVLLTLIIFASYAQADWSLHELKDGTIAAQLHGVIQEGDEEVPEADRYYINSGGGYVYTGYAISERLQEIDKPVYFITAGSIAALIAMETNAKPVSKKSQLGFHWAYSDENIEDQDDISEAVNTRTMIAMANFIPMRYYTKIVGEMDKLWGKDQSTSIVYWNAVDGNIVTIIEDIATNHKDNTNV